MNAVQSACRGSLAHTAGLEPERDQLCESKHPVLPNRKRGDLRVQPRLAEKRRHDRRFSASLAHEAHTVMFAETV
jgi:hypothetical protein